MLNRLRWIGQSHLLTRVAECPFCNTDCISGFAIHEVEWEGNRVRSFIYDGGAVWSWKIFG